MSRVQNHQVKPLRTDEYIDTKKSEAEKKISVKGTLLVDVPGHRGRKEQSILSRLCQPIICTVNQLRNLRRFVAFVGQEVFIHSTFLAEAAKRSKAQETYEAKQAEKTDSTTKSKKKLQQLSRRQYQKRPSICSRLCKPVTYACRQVLYTCNKLQHVSRCALMLLMYEIALCSNPFMFIDYPLATEVVEPGVLLLAIRYSDLQTDPNKPNKVFNTLMAKLHYHVPAALYQGNYMAFFLLFLYQAWTCYDDIEAKTPLISSVFHKLFKPESKTVKESVAAK